MAETRKPRNFTAMREDRVVAMAKQAFGQDFGSKKMAIDALATLPLDRQHALEKPRSGGKTGGTYRRTAAERGGYAPELRGGVGTPSAERLASARPDVLQRYLRSVAGLPSKSKAQSLTLLAKFGPTDVAKNAGGAIGRLRNDGSLADKKVTTARQAAIDRYTKAYGKAPRPRMATKDMVKRAAALDHRRPAVAKVIVERAPAPTPAPRPLKSQSLGRNLKPDAHAGITAAVRASRAVPLPAPSRPVVAAPRPLVGPRSHALARLGVAGAVALPAVVAANAYSATKSAALAEGKSESYASGKAAAVAAVDATATAGIVAGVGLALKSAARVASAIAPRLAPAVLGPAGALLAAGVAGYGAVQGYRKTGTLSGAAIGAVTGGEVLDSMRRPASGSAYLAKSTAEAAGPAALSSPRAMFGRGWRNGRGWANRAVQAKAQAARRRVGK